MREPEKILTIVDVDGQHVAGVADLVEDEGGLDNTRGLGGFLNSLKQKS